MPILPLTYGPKNFLQAFKVIIDKINEIIGGGLGGGVLPFNITLKDIAGTNAYTLDYSTATDKLISINIDEFENPNVTIMLPSSNILNRIIIDELASPLTLNLSNFPNITSLLVSDLIGDINFLGLATKLNDITIINVPTFTSLPNISSLVGLESLTVREINFSAILFDTFAALDLLLYIDFDNSSLPSSDISNNLVNLDTNGLSNGSYTALGGTNAPVGLLTPAGVVAMNNLIGKGWSILLNP